MVSIPLARGDSGEASGGYITQLNFSNSSWTTSYWQGFYGTIHDGNFIDLNMTGQGGNVSQRNITSTTSIRFLLFSNSTLDTFSGYYAGNLSQIDAIIGTKPDNATSTFLYQSDFILGSTTIYNVPTTYTYVNGSQQLSAFREGFLTNGKTMIFIVEVGRSYGFNSVSYDYQAILPISQSLNTYYVYAIPESTPSITSSDGGGNSEVDGGEKTNECTDIILDRETKNGFIKKNIPISYKFVSSPIIFLNFTSAINADEMPVTIEVLKNSPCIAKISPPGIVYKIFNLWIGKNHGFGVRESISQVSAVFEVNKNWIASNNINSSSVRLMQFTGNWIPLAIKQIGEDENVIFYIANPKIFSYFAIVGEKNNAVPSSIETPIVKPKVTVAPVTWIQVDFWLKILYLLFTLLVIVYSLRRILKKKKRLI
ncbi:MAG TPA: PGF-pre-PGF domain-containing protein [Candidatus Methanoperedens sp.]|nr:PGF-pre-PGF domain-containing protein [Candidatus Methanoperedens sp.]